MNIEHMEVMGSRGVDIKVYVWLRMVKGCEVEIYGDYLLNLILKVTKKKYMIINRNDQHK